MTTPIAIVGSGLIGQAWAISFATAGYQVTLWDNSSAALQVAKGEIGVRLNKLAECHLLSEEVSSIGARVKTAKALESALAGAVHIQECVPEDLTIKHETIEALDAISSETAVIASSTSALLPSVLFRNVRHAERCMVAHPINPPYLIRAVELVGSPKTSSEALRRCSTLLKSAGHEIVQLKREIDGFVVNRLQGALLDEAFRLVEEGVADPADVDVAIKDGLANRWALTGPFETIDLNAPGGVRDYVERYGAMYDRLAIGSKGRPSWSGDVLSTIESDMRAHLPLDQIGERARWRDEQLMKLRLHKRTQGLE